MTGGEDETVRVSHWKKGQNNGVDGRRVRAWLWERQNHNSVGDGCSG